MGGLKRTGIEGSTEFNQFCVSFDGAMQARLRPLKDSGLADHEELRALHHPTQPEIVSVLREIQDEAQKLNVVLSAV